MRKTLFLCTFVFTAMAAMMAESSETKGPQGTTKPGGSSLTRSNPAEQQDVDPTTGMQFVTVKGGCFQMGDVFGDGAAIEKPVHEVCVDDFSIGKFEVTQVQWQAVMGSNPSSRKGCGADCPVENVSWESIQDYITKLNSRGTAKFRLPTEAEWEYAARSGGKKEKWAGTADEKTLEEFAWFDKNSKDSLWKVGQKKPNSVGLYDMSGNIYEWCQDVFDESYYRVSPKDNPLGPATGAKRALRGGTFGREAKEARTTARRGDEPSVSDGDYGFRLVRIVK